jgi:CBS domain-containing protein
MQIKELIVIPITTCSLSTDVAEARDLMKLKKISALPIVNNKNGELKIEGIVS